MIWGIIIVILPVRTNEIHANMIELLIRLPGAGCSKDD